MALELVTIPCLKDNYAFLIHDAASGATAVIDVPDAAPIQAALDARGWQLTDIVLTHHHDDHIAGVPALQAATGARIWGAAADAHRLPPLDHALAEGDTLAVGAATGHVIDVSGHTVGHIAVYFPQDALVFTADSLMAAGCGRLFEGTPGQMWASLSKLAALPPEVPVFPIGVGSNLIVRDGGLRAVVIRLGRGFNAISVSGDRVTAGAAALDAHVARRAAEAGLDLTFLRTIPGSIGGAVRMNAGCYGAYVADVLESVRVIHRDGRAETLPAAALNLRYRQSDLPEGAVVVEATFRAAPGDPAALAARMDDQIAKRDASQPTKERSAGSTFRNPVGHSSTGRADDSHELKAWKGIDDAGLRGARLGGAQMSQMHSNFLINTGGATAADLENLGEAVRKKVFQTSGITLHWEIMRVGEPVTDQPLADKQE